MKLDTQSSITIPLHIYTGIDPQKATTMNSTKAITTSGWQGLAPVAKWYVGLGYFGCIMSVGLSVVAGARSPLLALLILLWTGFWYWCMRLIARDHNPLGAKIGFVLQGLFLAVGIFNLIGAAVTQTHTNSVGAVVGSVVGMWFSNCVVKSLQPEE